MELEIILKQKLNLEGDWTQCLESPQNTESNTYLKISFGWRRGEEVCWGKKKELLVRCSLPFGTDVGNSNSGI